jgi:glycine hydroxymethyltransferase
MPNWPSASRLSPTRASTANFDAGKTAALAQTMLDWTVAGPAYAGAMVDTARALADRLVAAGLPVFRSIEGVTGSHQFALEAASLGGGQAAAARLRRANSSLAPCRTT